MGFVKTLEEIMGSARETVDFYDAEMLIVTWETKPDVYRSLIPPPLKPMEVPLVTAFVARYPRTNFGVSYNESALFLVVEHNGEQGMYCLSMPVTNDMAMAGGREYYGYPKKMGDISFSRKGNAAGGWTKRKGVRFMQFSAQLKGAYNVEGAGNPLDAFTSGQEEVTIVAYNYKHFPNPEGTGFDYSPRLMRQEIVFRPAKKQKGTARVVLKPSKFDPWAEVEVVKLLGALYTKGNNSMRKGAIVAEVDMMAFAPHAFLKWDLE